MGPHEVEPTVRVVAGCLFEVSLAEPGDRPWQWANPRPEVTLLGEAGNGGVRRFRFRVEPAAVDPGRVSLRFRSENEVGAVVVRSVTVAVAPEAWDGGGQG